MGGSGSVGMVMAILTVLSGVPSRISISDDCSQQKEDRRECCVVTSNETSSNTICRISKISAVQSCLCENLAKYC